MGYKRQVGYRSFRTLVCRRSLLTEEEADRLWDEYEWEECEFPDIELYDIEVPQTDSNVWCSSEDFNQYIEDQAVQFVDIAFDGSVIVFYLKTF